MPSFSLSPSKPKTKEDEEGSPTKSSMRKLSGKLAKKVKRQLWRLDEVLHHVTHTQHNPNAPAAPRARAQSLPSSQLLHAAVPSSPRSSSSRDTWNAKYAQDCHSFDRASCSSDDHHLILNHLPATFSAPITTDILPEECHFLSGSVATSDGGESLHAQPVLSSLPTAETHDPSLINKESTADSEEQHIYRAAISPAHNTSLDLLQSALPDPTACQQQQQQQQQQHPAPPHPDVCKDEPPPSSAYSKHKDKEMSHMYYVPPLVVPTKFRPVLPNMRHPFSTNLLTWWLCRHFTYDTCTKPIHSS